MTGQCAIQGGKSIWKTLMNLHTVYKALQWPPQGSELIHVGEHNVRQRSKTEPVKLTQQSCRQL